MSRASDGRGPHPDNGRLFRAEARSDFRHVGAVAPSGIRLAAALAAVVPTRGVGARRILEAGAGTGAVTAAIAARLAPGDVLLAVERNAAFAAHLRSRVQTEPVFRWLGDGVRVLHADVTSVAEQPFDAVVSSLPFNNFTADEVRAHIGYLLELLAADGRLAFFEYLWVRRIRGLLSGGWERARLRGVGDALAAALGSAACPSRIVWRNLPPAVVHTLSRPPSPSATAAVPHTTLLGRQPPDG
jgi:phosphatidylethanolamine/phosphatidyl-N-methylethanolamine N-methyltransferase